MQGKISVIGEVPVEGTVAPSARGAEVIVAAAGEDVRGAARLAPAAVLLVVDGSPDDVALVLDATLWPRQRVIGVARSEVERAVRAVTTGDEELVHATLRDGECSVTLGRGGILTLHRPG